MSEREALLIQKAADLMHVYVWMKSAQHEAGRQMIEAVTSLDADAPIEPEMRDLLLRLARIGLFEAMEMEREMEAEE